MPLFYQTSPLLGSPLSLNSLNPKQKPAIPPPCMNDRHGRSDHSRGGGLSPPCDPLSICAPQQLRCPTVTIVGAAACPRPAAPPVPLTSIEFWGKKGEKGGARSRDLLR